MTFEVVDFQGNGINKYNVYNKLLKINFLHQISVFVVVNL